MAKPGQGVALDPPGAKPLDLKYMTINGFPKALGLSVYHLSGWYYFNTMRSRGSAPGGVWGEAPTCLTERGLISIGKIPLTNGGFMG